MIFLSDNYFFDNFYHLGINIQPFSFSGLVFASVIYSLPFAVQPILNGLQNLDQRYIEIAKINGLNKMDRFINVVLPLTYKNFLTAAILCFTHTIGEFGVILMIGGNIPGETKVLSIQIYEYVEILNYSSANKLGLFLIGLAFLLFSSSTVYKLIKSKIILIMHNLYIDLSNSSRNLEKKYQLLNVYNLSNITVLVGKSGSGKHPHLD